ncbi:MAG: SPOR domain-containing protein [Pyrinomonadaceae bacterium]
MKTTCPHCQLQGLVETAQLSIKPRVVCPRCAQSFEVSLFDDVLDLPLAPRAGHTGDLAPVFPDLSIKPAPAFLSASAQETQTVATLSKTDVLDEKAALPDEARFETSISRLYSENELIELEELPGFESQTVARTDKYGTGVRLMRISPVWIFVSGLALISLLLLLGSLRPAEKTDETAAVNPAVNEQSNRTIVRTTTAEGVKVEPAKVEPSKAEPPKPLPAKVETEIRQTPASVDANATASVKAAPVPQAESLKTVQTNAVATQQAHAEQSGNGYLLQFGSHPQSQAAEEQAARLRAAGVEARVVEALIPKRGTWYRVQAGNFANAEEATRYANGLRSRGVVGAFIVISPNGR